MKNDICFIVNVYDEDTAQIEGLVTSLRNEYPLADIIVAIDTMERKLSFLDTSIKVRNFPHIKTPEFGGEWTHRYLTLFLRESNKKYLIKLDPDTTIIGAIETPLPSDESAIFCRVLKLALHPYNFICGGALGFTRKMAAKIVSSTFMVNSRWKNNLRCGNYHDTMLSIVANDNNLLIINRDDFLGGDKRENVKGAFYHK